MSDLWSCRGEVGGAPMGELFGTFRVIVIDIQTIRNGKIAKTYPVQNWLNALNQ